MTIKKISIYYVPFTYLFTYSFLKYIEDKIFYYFKTYNLIV